MASTKWRLFDLRLAASHEQGWKEGRRLWAAGAL